MAFDAFGQSSANRDIKISYGTHLLHLDKTRSALWRHSLACLLGD